MKLQSSFLVFSAEEQYMKTPVKVSMKVRTVVGALSRMSIYNVNHLYVYFCGIRSPLTFLAEGRDATFVTPVSVPRKYHISMYFLRKFISHFLPKEKISCFREKIPFFQIIQERSCSGAALFEKTIF